MTQRELGRLCGLAADQVSRFETGDRIPLVLALRKMAAALGVSVDYLIGLTDEPHGQFMPSDLNVYEHEIVEAFRREGWPGVFRLGAGQMK